MVLRGNDQYCPLYCVQYFISVLYKVVSVLDGFAPCHILTTLMADETNYFVSRLEVLLIICQGVTSGVKAYVTVDICSVLMHMEKKAPQ